MPITATDILNGEQPYFILFEATLDNQARAASNHYYALGKRSGLGHPLGMGALVEDGSVALANGPVRGISCDEVMIGDLFIEESIGEPFEASSEKSIGGIDFVFTEDQSTINLHRRDWSYKSCTIKVGLVADDYADYKILLSGKTIGSDQSGNTVSIAVSAIPQGTQNLYPVEVYDSGDSAGKAKPIIWGSVKKITPVPIDQSSGLWQVHNGTVDTTPTPTPAITSNVGFLCDLESDDYLGGWSFDVNDVIGGSETGNSLARDALPADVVLTNAYLKHVDNHIEIKLPEWNAFGYFQFVSFDFYPSYDGEAASFEEDGLTFRDQCLVKLSDSSSISSATISGPFGDLFVRKGAYTIARSAVKEPNNSNGYAYFNFQKGSSAQDADTIILEMVGIERVFQRKSSSPFQFYDSEGKNFPSARVTDVYDDIFISHPFTTGGECWGRVHGFCVWDSNGYIRAPIGMVPVLDAVGSDSDSKSIAVCSAISTAANGSDSPVTASFAGEPIGYYANQQLPMLEHLRAILIPLDCFIKYDLTTNDLVVKYRFNRQPLDFAGVANDTESFEFYEDQDDFTLDQPTSTDQEPAFSRYVIIYSRNYLNPDLSPTVSSAQETTYGLSKVVDTMLQLGSDADLRASLVGRDAIKKRRIRSTLQGVGHDLELSSVGKLVHNRIAGKYFEIRMIRQALIQKTTLIGVVSYG